MGAANIFDTRMKLVKAIRKNTFGEIILLAQNCFLPNMNWVSLRGNYVTEPQEVRKLGYTTITYPMKQRNKLNLSLAFSCAIM